MSANSNTNKRHILLTDTRSYDVLVYDATSPIEVDVDGPTVLTFKEPNRSNQAAADHVGPDTKRRVYPGTTYVVEVDGPAVVRIDATDTNVKKITITRRPVEEMSGNVTGPDNTTIAGLTNAAPIPTATGSLTENTTATHATASGLTTEGHPLSGSSEIVCKYIWGRVTYYSASNTYTDISEDEGWTGEMEAPVNGAIYELRLARAPTKPPITGVILFATEERTMAGWLRESNEKETVVGILKDNHDVQARVTDVSEGWYWKGGVNRWGTVNWKLVCDEFTDCTCPTGLGNGRLPGGLRKKRNACEISDGAPMSDAGAETE